MRNYPAPDYNCRIEPILYAAMHKIRVLKAIFPCVSGDIAMFKISIAAAALATTLVAVPAFAAEPVLTRCALFHWQGIALNDQIRCGNLSAPIDQCIAQRLTFSEASKAWAAARPAFKPSS